MLQWDENCNWIVAELKPSHKHDNTERKHSELSNDTEPIDLREPFSSIARHKCLASETGNKKIMNLLEVEKKYENAIENKQIKCMCEYRYQNSSHRTLN